MAGGQLQRPINIVADENIPQVRECFSSLGEVRTLAGRSMAAADVADADILLVRSVTPVNAALLSASRVRFVGTATIGTDHLDIDYLQRMEIGYANAPGSNAQSVVDYVLSALAAEEGLLARLLGGKARVGVVGLGNAGGRLLRRLHALGIDAVGFDPYVDAPDLPQNTLEVVLGCEVVCLHTPLTRQGAHPTWHLLDESRIRSLRSAAVLLNAGRGAVIDNQALLRVLEARPDLRVMLDVWESEPAINLDLLQRVTLATPHIAGYSFDGKLAGTHRLLQACCEFLACPLPIHSSSDDPMPITVPTGGDAAAALGAALLAVYDPRRDDAALRAGGDPAAIATHFDQLRKHYPLRREIAGCEVVNWKELGAGAQRLLAAAGFRGAITGGSD